MAAGGEEEAALLRPPMARASRQNEWDPESLWNAVETRIAAFLTDIPAERQVRVQAEAFLARPDTELAALAAALGLPADADAVAAMLHPETSPFALMGPIGANFGDDPQFLRNPYLHPYPGEDASLDTPLPWRTDGAGFSPATVERARALGYV